MKKFLFIPFSFLFHFAYAGTGSGYDEIFFMLSIIAVMLFILAVLYSIDFIKRIIKAREEKKTAHHADETISDSIDYLSFTELS